MYQVDPWQLHDVPNRFNTQKICDMQCASTQQTFFMPVRSKTQGMYDAVVWMEPLSLTYIPNRFKT